MAALYSPHKPCDLLNRALQVQNSSAGFGSPFPGIQSVLPHIQGFFLLARQVYLELRVGGEQQVETHILAQPELAPLLQFLEERALQNSSPRGNGSPPQDGGRAENCSAQQRCLAQTTLDAQGAAAQLFSTIVLHHSSLAETFVNAGGIDLISPLLAANSGLRFRYDVTTDVLLIISQLSRLSKDYYPILDKCNLMPHLRGLLDSESAEVRSKTANVIGNISRHSDYFYVQLRDSGILEKLIPLCDDEDAFCRKFASFAVGREAMFVSI